MSRRDTFAGRNVDWMTFTLYAALVLVGWLMIYAVNYDPAESQSIFTLSTQVGKQTFFLVVASVIFFLTSLIDWKFWRTFAYIIYAFTLLLLIGVLIFGKEIKGATSWYDLGGFSLQPSEFAKFGTNIALAAFLSTFSTDLREIRSQIIAVTLFLMPMGLILLQPDAGSALVFLAFLIVLYREGLSANLFIFGFSAATLLILGFVYSAVYIALGLIMLCTLILLLSQKENRLYFLIGFVVLLGASIFVISRNLFLPVLLFNTVIFLVCAFVQWRQRKSSLVTRLLLLIGLGSGLAYSANFTYKNVLKAHQQDRIDVWLQPSKSDPQGALYNVLQSKMAIGSGGLQGKGFLQGTMTKLNYVPEQSTDFIFCTVGEEQGFIGTFGVIVLITLLLYRIIVLAERQRSDFSRYYAYGVAGILFVHFFINIGMTMGLVPIIGIPLPFISYGGSSILGFTLMMGVLLKLDSNRFTA